MALNRTRGRAHIAAGAAVIVCAAVITLVAGELLVRFVRPQPSMYPRWQYSPAYGSLLFPNRTMVHECPGRWRFTYSINAYGYRGRAIPISNHYDKANVVVLGDSYSFGTGVRDGEEYPAVIASELADRCDVVNLSVGGWGLTQEVRRFYEFGRLYDPKVVVLQFCSNDPLDNARNRVAVIEDGRLRFQDSQFSLNWVKRYLSDSILQKSQLYNLVRSPLYLRFARKSIDEDLWGLDGGPQFREEEIFYSDLLTLFAEDLARRGTRLLMISVDGHLARFPIIEAKVRDLESRNLVTYLEVREWLEDVPDRMSPEGHVWGKPAHRIIGEKLAEIIAGPESAAASK
jgi:hypothetical protein